MARNSIIQWTDDTLNALLGCFMCSLGCFHCYAIGDVWRMAHNQKFGTGDDNPYVGLVEKHPKTNELNWTGRIRFLPDRLYAVLRERQSKLFFVNSLSDLFYERLPQEIIQEHFRIFGMAYWHQFQALTKRSERLAQLSSEIVWPDNLWMGVSVERTAAMYRIGDLGKTGARVKFISFEPWQSEARPLRELYPNLRDTLRAAGIHWAIIGGESSKDKESARIMTLEDVRYLTEECQAAEVKVFLKQLGTRWAVEAGTYGAKDADNKRAEEVNSGGNPNFWPTEFRDPHLRQYPTVELKQWTESPSGIIYPTAERDDWKNWATPEMERAGNPKHSAIVQINTGQPLAQQMSSTPATADVKTDVPMSNADGEHNLDELEDRGAAAQSRSLPRGLASNSTGTGVGVVHKPKLKTCKGGGGRCESARFADLNDLESDDFVVKDLELNEYMKELPEDKRIAEKALRVDYRDVVQKLRLNQAQCGVILARYKTEVFRYGEWTLRGCEMLGVRPRTANHYINIAKYMNKLPKDLCVALEKAGVSPANRKVIQDAHKNYQSHPQPDAAKAVSDAQHVRSGKPKKFPTPIIALPEPAPGEPPDTEPSLSGPSLEKTVTVPATTAPDPTPEAATEAPAVEAVDAPECVSEPLSDTPRPPLEDKGWRCYHAMTEFMLAIAKAKPEDAMQLLDPLPWLANCHGELSCVLDQAAKIALELKFGQAYPDPADGTVSYVSGYVVNCGPGSTRQETLTVLRAERRRIDEQIAELEHADTAA